jgi:NAD(P)H dehydrogenase (quinone)
MKKILIINGHPDKVSFNTALADAYRKGALASGAEVKEIILADLEFDPNLRYGYRQRVELEPDLIDAREKITWAEHIVWVYPIWWGGWPSLLKGFIDRVFLPGFAFKYRENSVWWDRLLAGRSAHVINTLDQPVWYYWLVNGRPGYYAMKKMVLEFTGFKPVRMTAIGPIRKSTDDYRMKWLQKIEKAGRQFK